MVSTIDFKQEIEESFEIQKGVIQVSGGAFKSILSFFTLFFLRLSLQSALKKDRKQLNILKSLIIQLKQATLDEVLSLMEILRKLEKSHARIGEMIKQYEITGENRWHREILTNYNMVGECADLLRPKLYNGKPEHITDEEWAKYGKVAHVFFEDVFEDPEFDIYDAQVAPILIK